MSRLFENAEPIDDALVVLDLLCCRWGDHTVRVLVRYFPKDGPYVEIGHHRDFSDSMYNRFRVTDRVADQLLGSGYVKGKPQWGWTDMKELSISESGAQRLWEERQRLEMDDKLRSDWWIERVGETRRWQR